MCCAPGDNICVLLPRPDDETIYIDPNRQMCRQEKILYIFSRFWGSVTGLNASRMLCKVSSLILNLFIFNINMERFLKDKQRLKLN